MRLQRGTGMPGAGSANAKWRIIENTDSIAARGEWPVAHPPIGYKRGEKHDTAVKACCGKPEDLRVVLRQYVTHVQKAQTQWTLTLNGEKTIGFVYSDKLAPAAGLEPATKWLTATYSTD